MALSPEVLRERAIAAEQKLQQILQNPVTFVLHRDRNGERQVDIIPPWYFDSGAAEDFDITLGEDLQSQTNTEGGIRLGATGGTDYYCNVGSRETRIFAWELETASEIADRWELFWSNPQRFLQQVSNPQQIRWVLRNQT